MRKVLLAAAFAAAAALGAAAEPAPPPNDDEGCDDIIEELKDLTEEVTKDKAAARSPLAMCAVNGQLLGIAKATREVAAECYGEGKKREDLLAAIEKLVTDMEKTIGATCK